MRFVIVITDPAGWVWHRAIDPSWNEVQVCEWYHLAFVWDFDGIDGTQDRLRIYRDGVIVATNTDTIGDLVPYVQPNDPYADETVVLGVHASHRLPYPALYLDNIKVWDYAKTDF